MLWTTVCGVCSTLTTSPGESLIFDSLLCCAFTTLVSITTGSFSPVTCRVMYILSAHGLLRSPAIAMASST